MKFNTKKLTIGLLSTLLATLILPTKINVYGADTTPPPSIIGTMAVTLDYETGEIIYAKNIDDKAYPASTTKILTALLLAENKAKTDKLIYPESAKLQPEYSLYKNYNVLNVNDTMSADDVMKSLLLFSANDAAYMVAEDISGDVNKFSDLMNSRVLELGLKNTHFTNPNGLHDDNHYSTAYDLAVILREAYKNPWVSETMLLPQSSININGSNGTKIISLDNRNKYVGIDGNIGGKTGYTTPAGRCLVAVYEKDGRKIVGTVLKSSYDANDENVFNDMKKIINYSFASEKTVFLKAGDSVGTVPVKFKAFKFFGPTKTIDVPMTVTQDVLYYENDANKKDFTYSVSDLGDVDAWKLATSNDLAKLTVTDQRIYSQQYPLEANISIGTILKANALSYLLALVILVAIIAVILLIIRAINMRKRKRRRIF